MCPPRLVQFKPPIDLGIIFFRTKSYSPTVLRRIQLCLFFCCYRLLVNKALCMFYTVNFFFNIDQNAFGGWAPSKLGKGGGS